MVTVQMHGLGQLQRLLDELPEQVKRGGILMRGLRQGANVIRDEARRRAPVLRDAEKITPVVAPGKKGRKPRAYWGTPYRRRGAIRQGIVTQMKGFVDGRPTVIVRVRSRGYIFAETTHTRRDRLRNPALAGNPNYWWLVEFGTSKAPAQPFMRPAFEAKKFLAAQIAMRSAREEIYSLLRKHGRLNPMRHAT